MFFPFDWLGECAHYNVSLGNTVIFYFFKIMVLFIYLVFYGARMQKGYLRVSGSLYQMVPGNNNRQACGLPVCMI